MSKQLDGKTCQACHAYLFEDDDIVVCPECGAPYHRECYEKAGKCLLEQFHGTELEYDKTEKRRREAEEEGARPEESGAVCPHCGRTTHEKADFCPYCGKSMNGGASSADAGMPGVGGGVPMYGFVPYDPCGGVPKNTVIEDDVTAVEAAAFVGPRSPRYVKRFAENRKVSWNWAAFLCPPAWFAYRKLYSLAAATFAALLAAIICMVPVYSEFLAAVGNAPADATDIYAIVADALSKAPVSAMLLSNLSALIMTATSVLSGLFGDRAYRTRVITRVKSLKEAFQGENLYQYLAQKGSVNFWLFALILIFWFNSSTFIELLCTLF